MYWWRFNATGMVVGTAGGIVLAFTDRILNTAGFFDAITRRYPWFHWAPVWEFTVLLVSCTLICMIGSRLGRPTDRRVLEHFYRTTRPFGFWGPLKGVLSPDMRRATRREHVFDVLSVPFALLWQITLFLLPMQLIIGTWRAAAVTAGLCLLGLCGIIVFWYRNLPPARKGVLDGGNLELVKSWYGAPQAPAAPETVTGRA